MSRVLDIAIKKLFTIHHNPTARDFVDLYSILRKEKTITIDSLIRKTEKKFNHFIDPLQLSAQFVKAEMLKDYPTLRKPLPESTWRSFFLSEAKRLAKAQVE